MRHPGHAMQEQASRRVSDAVQTMIVILKQENAALQAMDFAKAGSLLAAKHEAADMLANAWRNAEQESPAPDGLQELGQLADQNRLLLARAMRVQRRVLDLVARAARAAQPQGAYGSAGRTVKSAIPPQSLKIRM